MGRKLLLADLRLLALGVNEYAGCHRIFVDIDATAARK
jgi:hypothetical protein